MNDYVLVKFIHIVCKGSRILNQWIVIFLIYLL